MPFGCKQDKALRYDIWICLDTKGFYWVNCIRYYYGFTYLDTNRICKENVG